MRAAHGYVFSAIALLLCGQACRKPTDRSAQKAVSPSAPTEHYVLRGVIRKVDAGRSEITVAHEDIPGYMTAMTMPFPVRDDPRVVGFLRSGDRIEAMLRVDRENNRYWLERVLTKGFVPEAATAAAQTAAATVTPRINQAVAPGDPVADFALTDQTGKTVRLSQFRGEPVAVTFLYTSCPVMTACPMTAAKFSKLDRLLTQKRFGRLLTITVDPEHDTPRVLADYARKIGADPKRWSFLTGAPTDVARVASDFGVLFYPDHGQIVHSLAAAVIGSDGKLATIYYGDSWEPEHLLRDLEKARSEG